MMCQDALHRIARRSRIDSDFPPKHLFSCEGPKLEDRRHGLERQGGWWLISMLGLWFVIPMELTSRISGKLIYELRNLGFISQ